MTSPRQEFSPASPLCPPFLNEFSLRRTHAAEKLATRCATLSPEEVEGRSTSIGKDGQIQRRRVLGLFPNDASGTRLD